MGEFHESEQNLTERTKDLHRGIKSLMEELEAVDWYQQRIDASKDEALRAVLAHNRDEEIEHACMVLEWLRRMSPQWDRQLRTYLFTNAPITEIEEVEEVEAAQETGSLRGPAGAGRDGSLGIGGLRQGR